MADLQAFSDSLVLTGPTAAGKTRLAITMAKELGAEIISMDSMALYRGMDIGTAKPSQEERAVVPHHLVDVLDPWQSASVAWWLEEAEKAACRIRARGRKVLFVGGTPLYLKALRYGLFRGPSADPAVRSKWEETARRRGAEFLHAELERIDAPTAARLHPNDVRRIVRALEVWEVTGRRLSDWQRQWKATAPAVALRIAWLDPPRQQLYTRINERVEAMFSAGLVQEVERLLALPHPLAREPRQALGYKEVIEHLEGKRDLQTTIALVQLRTRHFAKRQVTWFRKLPASCRVPVDLTTGHEVATMELRRVWAKS